MTRPIAPTRTMLLLQIAELAAYLIALIGAALLVWAVVREVVG